MDIVLYSAKDLQEWRQALAAALPEARVHRWSEALDIQADYAVVWKPPAALFAQQRGLRAILSLGAGVNALLADPALPADVPLVRMEDGGMAPQMEEYALYCALSELRRLPHYAAEQRAGRWSPRPLRSRSDLPVAVLGAGVMGRAAARALRAFGFPVGVWSRSPKTLEGLAHFTGEAGLRELLERSRLAIALLPLTADTTGLLDARRLAWLPEGAALVNLARGELVDDEALLAALDSGRLGHAYLDVFASEPLPAGHRFWSHPSISLTPHVAALTPFDAACAQIADKIRRLERGEAIGGVVDRSRGY
ncbi:MAG: glyoxylate/hydroxypyruvate reductase A [Gammaproteobacteria bacterium]|nr:glyoxylate/hydroxypyruvate reductase A [Gammaproteobacteria bacterium]